MVVYGHALTSSAAGSWHTADKCWIPMRRTTKFQSLKVNLLLVLFQMRFSPILTFLYYVITQMWCES